MKKYAAVYTESILVSTNFVQSFSFLNMHWMDSFVHFVFFFLCYHFLF